MYVDNPQANLYLNFKYKEWHKDDEPEASAIPLSKNPLKAVIDCLASAQSLGARIPPEVEREKMIDHTIEALRSEGKSDTDPELVQQLLAKNRLPEFLASHGACQFGQNEESPQINEAFADYVSGEAISQKLSGMPSDQAKVTAFESFGFFLSQSCNHGENPVVKDLKLQIAKLGCGSDGDQTDLNIAHSLTSAVSAHGDSHSRTPDRMNRIFLAHPKIRQALGCIATTPQEAKYCGE